VGIFVWNFAHTNKLPQWINLPHQKFQFVIKSKNDTEIFSSTLCYYNVDNYDILKMWLGWMLSLSFYKYKMEI
jgi:hypothetical protein